MCLGLLAAAREQSQVSSHFLPLFPLFLLFCLGRGIGWQTFCPCMSGPKLWVRCKKTSRAVGKPWVSSAHTHGHVTVSHDVFSSYVGASDFYLI